MFPPKIICMHIQHTTNLVGAPFYHCASLWLSFAVVIHVLELYSPASNEYKPPIQCIYLRYAFKLVFCLLYLLKHSCISRAPCCCCAVLRLDSIAFTQTELISFLVKQRLAIRPHLQMQSPILSTHITSVCYSCNHWQAASVSIVMIMVPQKTLSLEAFFEYPQKSNANACKWRHIHTIC